MKKKRPQPMCFYVTQFEAVWRLTENALRRILKAGAAGGPSIGGEGVTRLRVRLSAAGFRRREGGPPKSWRRRHIVLLQPLDQPPEWFRSMLAALDRQDFDEMRGFIGVEP